MGLAHVKALSDFPKPSRCGQHPIAQILHIRLASSPNHGDHLQFPFRFPLSRTGSFALFVSQGDAALSSRLRLASHVRVKKTV
jgi:hypothetical protein